MKKYLIVVGLLIVVGFWIGFAATESMLADSELDQLIKQTQSEETSDRVNGFKTIASYWDRRQSGSAGFSDLPTDAIAPNTPKPPISDTILNRIAAAIERGVNDSDSEVREAATIALISAPRSSDAVQSAILAGIKSDDSTVNWYVKQQRTGVWPKVDLVIENLIEQLSSPDVSKHDSASDLLREYSERARPYSERIVEAILNGDNHEYRYRTMYMLREIGLTEDAIKKLMTRVDQLTEEESVIVALSLLEYPDALQVLQTKHPNLIQSLERHGSELFLFLCKHQYEQNKTRAWLSSADSLPANIMGMLGETRFIEAISKLETLSSIYERSFLAACKRACGAKADLVIDVDASKPVKFRPASAWPNTDNSRSSKKVSGHSDGYVEVMVTGEIRGADGTHPKEVRFNRTNDAMLMGTNQDHSEPVMYDPRNGRFVFLTNVFAAYCKGEDQPEPGPYQTGSAQIRIEAGGFKPLVVQFFDEMPDVRITMQK
jgi:hypothetical protein